jgi:hypothetical protein
MSFTSPIPTPINKEKRMPNSNVRSEICANLDKSRKERAAAQIRK